MAESSLPGASLPAAGFEVPLEMLAACHGRIEAQLATLRRLLAHLPQHGADRAAREAAAAVMRYFDLAAPLHHADEEDDLFPALLESMAGSDAVCLRAITSGLAADHRALEQAWAGLRQRLAQLQAGDAGALMDGGVNANDGDRGAHAALAFIDAYEAHLAREDRELLPLAARLLSDTELDRIGLAMRQRRQLGDAA